MTCEFYVEGMHCAACELLIEDKLSNLSGIKKVDAKLSEKKVYISSDRELVAADLTKLVEEHGYRIVASGDSSKKIDFNQLTNAFLISLVVVALFLVFLKSGIVETSDSDSMNLPFVFTIGIVASLSSCMAVVGGLVLSLSSTLSKEHKIKPMITFHIARIVSFFLLGGLIGLAGSAFVLSSGAHFILNLVLFFVMLILGINLLEIFQSTKRLQIKMPKFLGKNVLRLQDSTSNLAPVLLGAATFILPCGFTQSMQVYSLSTGSFIEGAITMFVFALGTFPVLALISFASVKFSKISNSGLFFKTAGFIVIFFALFNFLGALAAIGVIEPVFNI